MIELSNVALSFGGTTLFSNCSLKFTQGNCYGIIGANGAGKSTFLRLLSGELEPSRGTIVISKNTRMSVLKQDHNAFDEFTVFDTVIQGNPRLYEVMKEKDGIYEKEEFSEADGVRAAELEAEFAELHGWEAESEASKLIKGLGLGLEQLHQIMSDLDGKQKFRVLLAQALFGSPDIILLDEPTNYLDIASVAWLEEFLIEFPGTVIVVSHNRHFLNNVCTHIVDIDYAKVQVYVGNYDFWYESSQLIQRMKRDQNKKNEEKAKELKSFIEKFSANKSKARQATARKKLLEKLDIEDLPESSRKYPYIAFRMDREPGKEILTVENLSKSVNGVRILTDVSFKVNRGDKIAFVGDNETAITTLFQILAEELEPDAGTFKWGISTSRSYFPKDNSAFFRDGEQTLIKWLEQYSKDVTETYLRGFLGRMLFSGDDVFKPVGVLSGGERMRCMFSRMMLFGANVLIADQPTNHLDLESITAVNNGFTDFKGIILFSSHDHQFIETVANRIIELRGADVIDRMSTYEDYIEAMKAAE